MRIYLPLLLFIGLAWGQDEYEGPIWHVSTTGSDETGDGSENNPYATIAFAQQNVADEQQRFDHDMLKVKRAIESNNLTLSQEEVDKLNAVMHNSLGYPITAY